MEDLPSYIYEEDGILYATNEKVMQIVDDIQNEFPFTMEYLKDA